MNSITPLAGQVAVVTGSGRGIGASIAHKLASLGANVVLCGRKPKSLETTASSIFAQGGQARAFACDVTELTSVQALASAVGSDFGKLDILVNNAGVGSFAGPLHEMTPQQWEKVLNTNL